MPMLLRNAPSRQGDRSVSAREAKPAFGTRTFRIIGIVAVIVVIVIVAAVAVALAGTSRPQFFSRYHLLNRRFVNLEASAHADIGCRSCHETQPVANGLALTADFYSSFFKRGSTPRFFQFAPPRNEACLKCHIDDWSHDATQTAQIPHPAHTRVASETRECVKCHKWTAHLENYLDKHKKMPFSGVCVAYGCHVGTKQPDQCYDCHHVLEETAAEWKQKHPEVVKTAGQNGCLESCHKVEQCQLCHTTGKTPEFTGLPIQIGSSIEKKHVQKDWTQKYHGDEALKDRDQCMLCHQTRGECDECHRYRPAFHGDPVTWIGRHSKSTKDLVDPRCTECHGKKFCEDCHAQFKEMN